MIPTTIPPELCARFPRLCAAVDGDTAASAELQTLLMYAPALQRSPRRGTTIVAELRLGRGDRIPVVVVDLSETGAALVVRFERQLDLRGLLRTTLALGSRRVECSLVRLVEADEVSACLGYRFLEPLAAEAVDEIRDHPPLPHDVAG